LDGLGLATHKTVEELTTEDIVRAAGRRVLTRPQLPPLRILDREPDHHSAPLDAELGDPAAAGDGLPLAGVARSR
jgi:hypothetical protein